MVDLTLEKLTDVLRIFNTHHPRPNIPELTVSEPCRVNDKEMSWPNCNNPGVYIMFSAEDSILYIGKASCNTNIGFRLGQHFKVDGTPYNENFRDVAHVRTIPIDKDHAFEAPALEEYLIRELNPPLNSVGRRY